MPVGGQRRRAAAQVLERRVDAGADDADGAEVSIRRTRSPKRAASSARTDPPRAGSRARARASAIVRMCSCLPATLEFVEESSTERDLRARGRWLKAIAYVLRMQHQHIALARDADDRPGMRGARAARPCRRRTDRSGQRRAVARA